MKIRLAIIACFLTICVFSVALGAKTTTTANKYLFVQSAKTAVLAPNHDNSGTYSLMLRDVSPYVTYFLDRPKRGAGVLKMSSFIDSWHNHNDANNMQKDPPNADLSATVGKRDNAQMFSVPMELLDINYNSKQKTVKYKVNLLSPKGHLPQKMMLRDVAVFIDDGNVCLMNC